MPSGGVHSVPSGGVWSLRAVSWPDGPARREQPASTRAVSTMMGHVPRRVGRDACPVGSRALERQYRDRQTSWRLVSSRRARIMADGTVSWFVGVDWGSEKHQVESGFSRTQASQGGYCPPGLKYAAGACVASCPSDYADQG